MVNNIHFQSGVKKLKAQDFELALSSFQKALEEEQNNPYILSEMGVTYFHLKQFKQSIQYLDLAVKLQPNNPYRFSSRAFIKGAIGDIKGAIYDYEKAIELDPSDAIAHNNLGLLQEQMGYKQKAKNSFLKADTALHSNNDQSAKRTSHAAPQKETPGKKKKKGHEYWRIVFSVFTDISTLKEFFAFLKKGFR